MNVSIPLWLVLIGGFGHNLILNRVNVMNNVWQLYARVRPSGLLMLTVMASVGLSVFPWQPHLAAQVSHDFLGDDTPLSLLS